MDRRLDLQKKLAEIMGCDHRGPGCRVYFQPSSKTKLVYPCIIYEQSTGKTEFASNMPYTFIKRYSVTVIDRNPDTDYVREMAMRFPMCTMDRSFPADNLHHYVFTLYY